jgi:UDP-N-acetylmuramate dehydrogenase
MVLPRGNRKEIYDEAREYQRQRISKQPSQASAGSFFKNVYSEDLAHQLPDLPEKLRKAGVVPAGYLIMSVGLGGYFHEGAMFSPKHANFIVNTQNASATAIRRLAEIAKAKVWGRYHVLLEEEVLYLGDWSRYQSHFEIR